MVAELKHKAQCSKNQTKHSSQKSKKGRVCALFGFLCGLRFGKFGGVVLSYGHVIFAKTQKMIVADTDIQELLTRGVERIYPSQEALEARLKSGDMLSIYYGIDPTGNTLHLGHALNLLKLRMFQNLGHEIIILYGGFTAQIGDPTDKLAARQPLASEQIKKNAANYKKLIGKILDLKKTNVRFLNNEQWSNKLKPKDVLNLAAHFTVSQLLERDMFQERLKHGKEVRANELLYPVFQAYDAVIMDVDIQIGGNDQTFNMLAGRTLMRKMKNKEKFVMAMKLLVDPSSGKKMGKTEGNMVTLEDAPTDIYGKVMSWPDAMILPGFELCTLVPVAEIVSVRQKLEAGANPKESKMRLAREIVALCHSEEKVRKAEESFVKTFQEGKPQEFIEVRLSGQSVSDALIEKDVIASKSELRRLLGEGAVINLDGGAKMGEDFLNVEVAGRYRIGKRRFVRIQ